jgi:hypothetical protein
MPSAKAVLFLLTVALAGATWLYHGHAFKRDMPVFEQDGQLHTMNPGNVALCTKAAFYSKLGAPGAARTFRRCEVRLAELGLLDLYMARWRLLGGGIALTLVFGAAFALAVKLEEPPARVVRGPRRLTGRRALAGIRRVSREEFRNSGSGVAFPPGIARRSG